MRIWIEQKDTEGGGDCTNRSVTVQSASVCKINLSAPGPSEAGL